MKQQTKQTKKIFLITILFFGMMILFGLLLYVNAAKDIELDNVDVSPRTIKVGETFNVLIRIKYDGDDIETGDDIRIKIYKNDILIHDKEHNLPYRINSTNTTYTFNISSTQFRVDNDDIWSRNLMDYECDEDQEIRVEISGDVKDASDGDKVTIDPKKSDYELSFTISPERPKSDEKITIHVEDEDGDDLKDAKVKFTRLGDDDEWDYDDDYREKTTDNDGEVNIKISDEYKFKDAPLSKYQVDVWKVGEYCKVTKFFDTRRNLSIVEIPSPLLVGKAIKVKVVDDAGNFVAGATVTLSKTGFSESYKTDLGGYVSFTLSDAAIYDAIASKSGYIDSGIVKLDVKSRGSVGVSINPKDALVGKEVKIVITSSEGALLEGAKIVITKPDGTQEVKTTTSTGQISFIPQNYGSYKVKAEEASHLPTEDTFTAMNEFTIVTPEKVELNKDMEILVKDQNGYLVEGATVSVSGTTIAGTTDVNGKFSFKLQVPGEFTITVKKTGFKDGSSKISILGELSLQLSSTEIYVDESLGIKVLDAQKNEIKDATVEITKPDGSKETVVKDTYIPNLPGNYTVTAAKASYSTAIATFLVKKLPLELKAEVKGDKLIVTVTSREQPLANIPVLVDTIFGGEEIISDEFGIAEITLVNITEKMNVTVTVDQAKYEKQSLVREVGPSGIIPLVWILLIILILLLILAVYFRQKKEKGEEKRRKPSGAILLGKGKREEVSLGKV